jgi:hypothetical protein
MEMRRNAESTFATSSAFIPVEISGLIWEFRLRILDFWDRCAQSFYKQMKVRFLLYKLSAFLQAGTLNPEPLNL